MPLDFKTLAVVRADLRERRCDIERLWNFHPEMTEDEAITRWGVMSHAPSSLHILHFGEYQLLGRLLEDYHCS